MEIQSNETELIGGVIYTEVEMIYNETVTRINKLVKNYLVKIGTDKTGWEILYQDPKDKRYWGMVFPQGDLQGGGVPSLVNISEEIAMLKFNIDSK
ncbi:Imm27 family immunity protein [uncultured Flavobacterium sp.]|mgnify:CR=1 FL=1|uniref:Imm27 family immunity protein n=1 Tax=uncultured Flavobacterium sp. TaxID=165435 RepID=UPI0025CBD048|nr:Imm27 family immunity protein [uncultured Flavobacterium sp.]